MNTSLPPTRKDDLAALEARLTGLAFERTGACFVFQDRALHYLVTHNLPALLPDHETRCDADLFGDTEAERLSKIKRMVLETGEAQTTEVDLNTKDGATVFDVRMERVPYPDGTGVLSVISNVTGSRHREKVLKTLLRELSHRSKNLLAIIQGIATQTAHQALSLETFLIKFRGRIQSLSNSQDLVTDSSWRGAFLFELARRQLAPYWPDAGAPMPLEGLDAHLSPNAALHVGLALHELIVNSASHGVIAASSDGLRITCSETEYEGEKAILLVWSEKRVSGSFEALPEGENSFAHTVLERVVPVAIGGKSLYVVDGDRVEYCLTIPEREFDMTRE